MRGEHIVQAKQKFYAAINRTDFQEVKELDKAYGHLFGKKSKKEIIKYSDNCIQAKQDSLLAKSLKIATGYSLIFIPLGLLFYVPHMCTLLMPPGEKLIIDVPECDPRNSGIAPLAIAASFISAYIGLDILDPWFTEKERFQRMKKIKKFLLQKYGSDKKTYRKF